MKNKIYFLALIVFIFAACKNQSKTTVTTKLLSKMNEPSACYNYSKDSNNVMMHISIVDNMVKGDLLIEYYQKDKNKGKIIGEMKGDTLYAEYTFNSEGLNSVREVAFLKKGNEFNEGFGDVEEKSGKMIFKNKATIKFENSMPLTKIKCTTIEH